MDKEKSESKKDPLTHIKVETSHINEKRIESEIVLIDRGRPRYSRNFLVGYAGGICGLIPGFSAGTIFYIFKSWDLFLNAMKNAFTMRDKATFAYSWFVFLTITAGLGAGYLSFVFIFVYILIPFLSSATIMFFGFMVIFSVWSIVKESRHIKKTGRWWALMVTSFMLLLTIIIAFFVVLNNTVDPEESSTSFWTSGTLWSSVALIVAGAVTSIDMVMPGVSGAMILLLIGLYGPIMTTITEFFTSPTMAELSILLFFLAGIFAGLVASSMFFIKLQQNHEAGLNAFIVGFVLASIIGIFLLAPSNGLHYIEGVYMPYLQMVVGISLAFLISIRLINI